MKNIHTKGLAAGGSAALKAAAASAMLLTGLTFSPAFANPLEMDGLKPVYHLYDGEEYLGAVTDKGAVDSLVSAKIAEAQPAFAGMELEADKDFQVIKEQVFKPAVNDEQETLSKVTDSLEVKTPAVALSVNGAVAVHVEDEAAYHETLRELKLAYATPEELAQWEESGDAEEEAELKAGESRITDISIKANLSGKSTQADPEAVMTAKEAAHYLLTGERIYTASDGDSARKIAKTFSLESGRLAEWNNEAEFSKIKEGTKLVVAKDEPRVAVEIEKLQNKAEPVAFQEKKEDDAALLIGKTKVKQQGKKGEKHVTTAILAVNGKAVSEEVVGEETVREPVDKIIAKGTKELPSIGTGRFAWPAEGGYISSERGQRWGRLHNGIDIAQPDGPAIKSADHGVVKAAGAAGTFGNRVIVDHQNGYETIYAHLSSIDVRPGQKVPKGTKLGNMGNTGRSTGVHLHFEVSLDGKTKNPLNYLK
ncbi:peptidoglycan DD-metalloendopeptidase family protein [Planococcus chinensis]|uniref:Peptidoglycan DD-metalloendopeptidase family protein n=1 Tax=Planococcus chinensis TaxID=272917 RepID=A0ABW4QIK7_9BACL